METFMFQLLSDVIFSHDLSAYFTSLKCSLLFGIPHGSVTGPILFISFMVKVFDIITS